MSPTLTHDRAVSAVRTGAPRDLYAVLDALVDVDVPPPGEDFVADLEARLLAGIDDAARPRVAGAARVLDPVRRCARGPLTGDRPAPRADWGLYGFPN